MGLGVPPEYNGNSFNGVHTHYRTTGAATLTSGDLDELIDDFKAHGYSAENGSQIAVFVNTAEANIISGWRVAGGDRDDFIPARGARFFSPDQLVGDQPANTFAGFPVRGAYGEALIIEDTRIPAGYVVGLVSGGANLPNNPIMFREHSRLKGLKLIKGRDNDYPLIDSFYVRGFGTGVRHRGAGMVMQVTANASYTPPARRPNRPVQPATCLRHPRPRSWSTARGRSGRSRSRRPAHNAPLRPRAAQP